VIAELCVALLLNGQQPGVMGQGTVSPAARPAQSRDTSAEKKGSAVLKGHVKTADGRVLRRAQVSVRGTALPSPRTASTGLEGEYEIGELPAGRYTITASRSGFLASQYGQRRYGDQGKPLEVADGVTIDSIDFMLERAGVISGRVTDEAGEPVANASIYCLQSQFYRGRRQFIPVAASVPGHATTDDAGMYRLTSVAPGEYVVMAKFSETWVTDDREKQTFAYAPSYFPGTANAADVQRIKVAAGQEAGAIDFSLVAARAATISGSVTAADGAPLGGAHVGLTQEVVGPSGGSIFLPANVQAATDGTFTLRNIAPGQYILRASGPAGDRGVESATMELTVAGADIRGLTLGADAGGLVAGRVVTDSGEALPSSDTRVATQSAIFDRSNVPIPPAEDGRAGADGRFIRRGPTGPAFVRIGGLPPGWALKRVQIGERDVTDSPVEIRAGQTVADIAIVISNRLAGLGGTVTDARGRPAGAPVVLFPADPAKWHELAGSLRSARPDQAGKYRFDTVRPGDYLIVAVEEMEPWQVNDPEFLTALRDRAAKITIGGEPVTLDLRVTR
jgi:protocatechuate 3,4-dioxygenase beta subunit